MAYPSKYKKEYCEKVILHMTCGLSFESFAGVISVTKDTIYKWLKKYEDFKEAKEIANMKCLLYWEKEGMTGLYTKGFNATTWIFNMKNRFNWHDKMIQETTSHNVHEFDTPGKEKEYVYKVLGIKEDQIGASNTEETNE